MAELTLAAHAKINLLLRILSRESDGYHGLETLFCRITLADQLEFTVHDGPAVTLEVEGNDALGPAEDNLVVRAARAVQRAVRGAPGFRIRLVKRIPAGAGLGGGSADAAATLRGVNQLLGSPVPNHELLQLAAGLGADVPFCLSDSSLALAWGHGERLLRLPPLPSAPLLLVNPGIPVATPAAYRWIDEARGTDAADAARGRRGAVALDLDALSTWGSIARMSGNDFESVVFGREPRLRAAFEAVVATQPLLGRMTGSGSTLVGVYRTPRDRDDARDRLGKRHGGVIAAETG